MTEKLGLPFICGNMARALRHRLICSANRTRLSTHNIIAQVGCASAVQTDTIVLVNIQHYTGLCYLLQVRRPTATEFSCFRFLIIDTELLASEPLSVRPPWEDHRKYSIRLCVTSLNWYHCAGVALVHTVCSFADKFQNNKISVDLVTFSTMSHLALFCSYNKLVL